MDIMQKKQVIASVLADFLSPAQLDSAMHHWQSYYSREPAFVLQKFLKEICTTDELKMARAIILQALIKELNQEASAKSSAVNTPSLSKTHQCFETLIQQLLVRAKDKEYETYDKFTAQLAQTLESEFELETNTLTTEQRLSVILLAEHELNPIVSVVYELLCEWYGPVDADTLYANAIHYCKTAGFSAELSALI